jgi:FkbH-like protein
MVADINSSLMECCGSGFLLAGWPSNLAVCLTQRARLRHIKPITLHDSLWCGARNPLSIDLCADSAFAAFRQYVVAPCQGWNPGKHTLCDCVSLATVSSEPGQRTRSQVYMDATTSTDLPWLEPPSRDFRNLVRALAHSTDASQKQARRLSLQRLNINQLHLLGNAIGEMTETKAERVRLGVLSNGTTELLLPPLAASALRHGVWLQTVGSAFDQVAAEALNAESSINLARCHFVLLAVDHRGLPLTPSPGDLGAAQASLSAAVEQIDSLRQALRAASGCSVIVQTIPQVPAGSFGSLERTLPGTLQWLIEHFNDQMRARLQRSSDLLLDVAALAEGVGLGRWHQPTQWTLGKFPFALEAVPLYADWVGRLIAAARGKSRKCLVLDLDNTLWGGVVGDDGLAGIILGNGDPVGEAFLDVQRTALALRERGIILAVSSKNDETTARGPFRSHPEMLIKEQHIAVFQANWQDKASNLKAIAQTLNIGLEALVLLDDNAAERAQVREALPEVAVPELPPDPALYGRTLLAAGYFEATQFTAEDQQRADLYSHEAARSRLLGAATDLGAYLRSLQMKAICSPFDAVSRARIAQLVNKSNQFNLTTRRYTEADIETFAHSPAALTAQVRLTDRFGDNGMVAVVICKETADDHWLIDTWLMSCRVLNRQLEQATLNYIVARAKAAGARVLIGEYRQTGRNGMVKDHYQRLGFMPLGSEEGVSSWRLDVASYVPAECPIEIVAQAATTA